jgi:hypothetical protein
LETKVSTSNTKIIARGCNLRPCWESERGLIFGPERWESNGTLENYWIKRFFMIYTSLQTQATLTRIKVSFTN